jgi:hypothetical protein
MAGLTEDGGEGGKAEIGFGGIPVRREDEQDLHLPAAGGFRGLSMELDQFFGSPFALRILNPHTGLRSYPLTDKKQSESQGVTGVLYGRGRTGVKGGEAVARQSFLLAEAPR